MVPRKYYLNGFNLGQENSIKWIVEIQPLVQPTPANNMTSLTFTFNCITFYIFLRIQ